MLATARADVECAARWTEVVGSLHDEVESLVDDASAPILDELRSFGDLPKAELRALVRASFDAILEPLAARQDPDEPGADPTIYATIGEMRASQGVAIEDMLASWRFMLGTLRSRVRLSVDAEREAALLLEIVELATRWIDFAMLSAAAGHRRVGTDVTGEVRRREAQLIRRLLGGPPRQSDLEAAASLGLDPHGRFHAVRARITPAVGIEELESFLRPKRRNGRRLGVLAVVDGDLCGLLTDLPEGAAPGAVGVSIASPLTEIADAFRLSARALETAVAIGARGIFDLPALALRAAVLADDDIGKTLVARYVTPFENQGTTGKVVMETVERFLSNDGGLEATSKDLSIHVNTVRYRLSRFEERTGCSLRETEGIVEVWWALQRARFG